MSLLCRDKGKFNHFNFTKCKKILRALQPIRARVLLFLYSKVTTFRAVITKLCLKRYVRQTEFFLVSVETEVFIHKCHYSLIRAVSDKFSPKWNSKKGMCYPFEWTISRLTLKNKIYLTSPCHCCRYQFRKSPENEKTFFISIKCLRLRYSKRRQNWFLASFF